VPVFFAGCYQYCFSAYGLANGKDKPLATGDDYYEAKIIGGY
jgi:hypothetical protein